MAKVYLVIASEGYQPVEYGAPKKVLTEAGFEVLTVSDRKGLAKAAYDNTETKIDLELSEVKIDLAEALYLVGGPGALEHLDNEEVYKLLREWQGSGKPYGAICISPRILAKAGVLKNKKATGWNGDHVLENFFPQYGVEYVGKTVVEDDNVITADGPSSAEEFGEAIVKMLKKRL